MSNELTDPAATLGVIPLWRRALIGLFALISGLAFGLAGSSILYGVFVRHAAAGIGRVVLPMIGSGCVLVAIFLEMVWLRAWFGSRPWLDRAINRIFMRSSVYLIVILLLFLFMVTRILLKHR